MKACRDCTIVASDVGMRQCDYNLCNDCDEERKTNPPAPGSRVARKPNWKKERNNVKSIEVKQSSSKDDSMKVDDASKAICTTYEKQIDSMTLDQLQNYNEDETRKQIQMTLTSILPSDCDKAIIANISVIIISKLSERIKGRIQTLSSDVTLTPMTFADRILQASPLRRRPTMAAATSVNNAPTILPYHDKRNQLTFLAKLSYHFEMVEGDDIYLISSQTFNYHNLNPKI